MDSTFIDRLLLFMEKEGINDNQMTVSAGLSVGVVGKMRKGITKGLNSSNIEKILYAYPQLSATWLLTGVGNMVQVPLNANQDAPCSSDSTIEKLLAQITDQAIEIGALREQIRQLKREKGKNASDAQTSGIADAV